MRCLSMPFALCLLLGPCLTTIIAKPDRKVENGANTESWPDFRGPTGQGHYAGKNLPIEWSTTKNVAWKTAIPGKGWSSPIVLAGRVYVTSALPIAGSKDQS